MLQAVPTSQARNNINQLLLQLKTTITGVIESFHDTPFDDFKHIAMCQSQLGSMYDMVLVLSCALESFANVTTTMELDEWRDQLIHYYVKLYSFWNQVPPPHLGLLAIWEAHHSTLPDSALGDRDIPALCRLATPLALESWMDYLTAIAEGRTPPHPLYL